MEKITELNSNNLNLILKKIRADTNGIYNRLHSIHEDSQFVSTVAGAFPNYPLFANQRCGAWYADKNKARSEFVYFKSTDGHHDQWNFNLRRANLHLLPIIQTAGGMIITDSTRAGKRFPDALSKTVPLWCAVINKAIELKIRQNDSSKNIEWDKWDEYGSLFTPPTSVGQSEHDQMANLVPHFAEKLLASSFPLVSLSRPLRPLWITPQSTPISLRPSDIEFIPVICVSASKLVADGLERRSNGYVYIQGSGDDHESWSLGLTPDMFWNHHVELLHCDRDALPDTIARIVGAISPGARMSTIMASSADITAVNGMLAFSGDDMEESSITLRQFDAVVRISSPIAGQKPTIVKSPQSEQSQMNRHKLEVAMSHSKQNQVFYVNNVLPAVHEFGSQYFGEGKGHRLLIIDTTGTYDASIGVMMLLLASFFNESGEEVKPSQSYLEVTKEGLRTRLEWIQRSLPRANPSRTTMKRVNEYAISMKLPSHRLSMSRQYNNSEIQ